jgi:hypothetical protein
MLLTACQDSVDPAEGGFFNGIAGVAGGGYDARIAERAAEVGAAEVRNQDLTAQLAALRAEHSAIKNELIQKRAKLRAAGIRLSAGSERQIQAALAASPQKIASLRKAIADARVLSQQLTALVKS